MRVVVIGAGLLGTSAAYFLAERGHAVVVLDRADGVARETSYANGGIIHASNAAPWNTPDVLAQALRWGGRRDAPLVVRPSALPGLLSWGSAFLYHSRRDRFERSLRANATLAVYSLRVLAALRERTGLRYCAGRRGCIAVFRDRRALDRAQREAAILAHAGVRHEALDPAALAAHEPALSGGFAGGIRYPDDESGDAYLFTRELAARARAHGAEFRFDTTVRRLLRERGAAVGVATDGGELRADACVLAAGSYSGTLAKPLGLALPIYPVKGHSITLALSDPERAPATPIIDGGRKIVTAMLGKRLRVAGFAEFAGYDARPERRRAAALLRGLGALFPELAAGADPERLEPWAGLRPMTADGRPLLGACPVRGLYLATGTGHLGWTFAAGAGRLVADIVAGAAPEIDAGEFSYRRR